jgi:hypothetical protein
MSRRAGVIASLTALATVLGVVGCASMEPAIQRYCVAYPPLQTWWEDHPASVTACNDEGVATVLQFKSAGGEILTSVESDVSGCLTVPMRSGTKVVDWKTADDKGSIPVPLFSGSLIGQLAPLGASEHVRLCLSVDVDVDQPGFAYAFRTLASSLDQADALVDPILQGGPGMPVPPVVTVGLFVEAELEGGDAVIRSSLPGPFQSFHIEAQGRLLADLATGLNVEASQEPGGWLTLTSVLPLDVVSARETIVLRQRGRHDDRDGEVVLAF